MRNRVLWTALAVAASALLSGTASAHHSGAMFDRTKELTLSGTLKELEFVNPHAWLQMMVVDATGKPIQWGIEFGGGAASLFRMGFKKTDPRPGDKISVIIHPLRDGRTGGSFVRMTFPDGRTIGEGRPVAPSE